MSESIGHFFQNYKSGNSYFMLHSEYALMYVFFLLQVEIYA